MPPLVTAHVENLGQANVLHVGPNRKHTVSHGTSGARVHTPHGIYIEATR